MITLISRPYGIRATQEYVEEKLDHFKKEFQGKDN